MGNIYQSLAAEVFLWLGFTNSRCSGGTWDFFITGHYMEQAGISILAQGRFPMGAVSIFLAYLAECSSEMSGFFTLGSKHNTKPLSLVISGKYWLNSSVLPLRI